MYILFDYLSRLEKSFGKEIRYFYYFVESLSRSNMRANVVEIIELTRGTAIMSITVMSRSRTQSISICIHSSTYVRLTYTTNARDEYIL